MKLDKETGELTPSPKLNEIITIVYRRGNGTIRIQHDFQNCPSMAEQHTAHLTNINYLMEKYKPDELAQYIAARNSWRQEILGHDFSSEPSLQEAKNAVYVSRKAFDELPDSIKTQFKNHVEFLKFIDNPANAEKMQRLGILTKKQVEDLQNLEPVNPTATPPETPTQEKEHKKEQKKQASKILDE